MVRDVALGANTSSRVTLTGAMGIVNRSAYIPVSVVLDLVTVTMMVITAIALAVKQEHRKGARTP